MMLKIEKLAEKYLNLRKRITLLVIAALTLVFTITFIVLLATIRAQRNPNKVS